MFFVSFTTIIIYSNSTYIEVPMMRSMQLKLIQIKQGLLALIPSAMIPFLNLYTTLRRVKNNTIRISSRGSTELKRVHNRVDPGFDSLVSSVGTSTHHLLI
jgi:hypothetical protein